MKPFSESESLIEQQKCFNYHLSRAQIVVENTFGRLKARWRCLMKQNDMHLSNVITACCILHNICELHGETFDNNWLEELQCTCNLSQPTPAAQTDAATGTPHAIRDAIVNLF